MKCDNCGMELPEGAKFCGNCGNVLEPVQPVQEQPMVQPVPVVEQPVVEPVQPTAPVKEKKKGKKGIVIAVIIVVLLAIAAAVILFIMPKTKKIDYRGAYKEIVSVGEEIDKSFSNDYCGRVVAYEKSTYYTPDDYISYIEKCKNNYGISLLPEVEKLGKSDAVKRDKEIKEQYDKFKAEYDKIYSKADNIDAKLEEYQNMHKFKYETRELLFSKLTDDQIDIYASYLEKSNLEEVKTYVANWKEKFKAHAAVIKDSDTDLDNMLKTNLVWEHSAEWTARYNVSLPAYKEVLNSEPTIGTIYPFETMNYYNLKQEYKMLRTLIATKYQENYKKGSNDCDENGETVVCK